MKRKQFTEVQIKAALKQYEGAETSMTYAVSIESTRPCYKIGLRSTVVYKHPSQL